MKKKLNMITKTLLKAKKKNSNQNQKLNHKHTILMDLMMTRENLPKSKKRKVMRMAEILKKLAMTKVTKVSLLNPSWDRSRHQLQHNTLCRKDRTWPRLKI
jgi:hypothetical protein